MLLEHQSTPRPMVAELRLLKYSIRIWERDRRRYGGRCLEVENLVNKTEEIVELYGEMREWERPVRKEQLATIEQLVRTGVAWSTIEAATGIDEEAFDRLKHRFDSADNGESHRN